MEKEQMEKRERGRRGTEKEGEGMFGNGIHYVRVCVMCVCMCV